MSKESVLKFFEVIRTDEAVAEELRAAGENVDDFLRLSAKLGRERGFEFEPASVREALDELALPKHGELSDQELSAVSGGEGETCSYTNGRIGMRRLGQVALQLILRR
jgi:predicted ribosomally synthesized peptide with nif11-like leader